MNIYHLMLLVLVVMNCNLVTIGISSYDSKSTVLHGDINNNTATNSNSKTNSNNNINTKININSKDKSININNENGNKFTQVTIDANSVVTSSEMQGATPKTENIRSKLPKQLIDGYTSSSTITPTSINSSTPEPSTLSAPSNHTNGTNDKLSQQQISATTHRPVRNGSGQFQSRDTKLMSLLAARRSALQLGRYRTNRRVPPANATIDADTSSASSKNSSDPRTTCERNCTKNFTRRTTASCMRRCIMMHKVPISITTSAITSKQLGTSSTASKIKVDEKDNNEILLTDESSHGFFVVTKELNDTVNHISSETKVIVTSTEKNQKLKSKPKQSLSNEEIDMTPYVYFGRKLPPLKPTVLRISKVDENPKVLEVSVTKPTERTRGRTRYHLRERNIVAYNRRHGFGNLTRTSTTTIKPLPSSAPVGLFRESSEEKLIKEATKEDNMTVSVLTRSAENQPLAKFVLDSNSSASEEKSSVRVSPQNLTPVTLVLEDQSTPLIISVPEVEETTTSETTTTTTRAPKVRLQPNNFPYVHNIPEEKPNLIIFFNVTKPPPQNTASTASPTSTAGSTATITTSTTTTTTTTPSTTTIGTTTTSTTTTSTSSTTDNAPSSPSAVEGFTRTTVSSSVRSTTNPRFVNTTSTTRKTSTTESTLTNQSTSQFPTNSNKSSSSSGNFSFLETFPNVSPNFREKNPSTPDTAGAEGNIIRNNEVTIEMQRINMATYVLAGLGMFPLVVIILYIGKTLIFKRRMKDDTDLDHCMNDEQPITPVRKMDQIDDDNNDQYSISSDREFDRSNLRFKSLLGEGNFGQVWKAEADDLSGHMGTTRIVAVKTVREGSSQSGLKEEAQIMRKLGSHPNVVTLLGACIETEPHLLIMEYAMRGRLLSLLRAARSATNILPASVPGGRSLAPLSPRTLAGFALDIARGMEYISDRRVVHRDLAARNILLDHNGICKICDFGMSIDLDMIKNTTETPTRKTCISRHGSALENRFRFDIGGRLINHWSNHTNRNSINSNNNSNNNNNNNVNQTNHEKKHHDSISKRPALPIRWMAPEALQYHIFSTETDVWAFGIVLWEIATLGCTPYPNLSGREVIRCVPNGTRPDPPKDGRTEFWDLMCRCWHKDPRDRPTFRESRIEISRSLCKWVEDDTSNSDYMDVSGFSEDLEHGMVYFNRRISEFECEI